MLPLFLAFILLFCKCAGCHSSSSITGSDICTIYLEDEEKLVGVCRTVEKCPEVSEIFEKGFVLPDEMEILNKKVKSCESKGKLVCCLKPLEEIDVAITEGPAKTTEVTLETTTSLNDGPITEVHKIKKQLTTTFKTTTIPYESYDDPITTEVHKIKKQSTTTLETTTIPYDDPLADINSCELTSDRLIGGTKTSPDQYPWFARIFYVFHSKTQFLCGGTLINRRFVLSAAHCFQSRIGRGKFHVRLGDWDSENDPDCYFVGGNQECNPSVVDIEATEIIMHENYKLSRYAAFNDIALMKLKEPAEYSDTISQACLPLIDNLNIDFGPKDTFLAVGFGRTQWNINSGSRFKEFVKLPFINCNRNDVICAGESGKDTCKGDSGGPIHYIIDGNLLQVGLTSTGAKKCGNGATAYYTKIAYYMDWILAKLKKHSNN